MTFAFRSHTSYEHSNHWAPPITNHSLYQTNSFAQSIFDRTAPSSSYPTPPPPGISAYSSSLAFALGNPNPAPSRPVIFNPSDSTQFMDNFLAEKTREIATARPAIASYLAPHRLQDSPDPLALGASPSKGSALNATPRKRKQGIHLETPSLKRAQSNSLTPKHINNPSTPTSVQTPVNAASTASKSSKKVIAFIDVPPLPKDWRTPSKSVGSLSKKMHGKMKVEDTPDDLGGYGSVDEDSFSPPQFDPSPTKSSARRTGDRDERGTCDTRLTFDPEMLTDTQPLWRS